MTAFRTLLTATAVAVVATAAAVPASAAPAGSAAGAAAVAATAAVKPTVVLVHGAWADSSAWNGEVTRLQTDGYTVRVFPTPLRGLASDSAYLRGFLATISGPIVLVGHSYGGAVISNAATGLSSVRALVYVDAFVPKKGESVARLATAHSGSVLANDPATVFDVAPPYAGAPAGDADLYVKQPVFISSFANDLPADQAAAAAAAQRPITASAVNEKSGNPAWTTIPSWYVAGKLDRVLPPAEQRYMAERAHANLTVIAGSHLSIQSQPAAITTVIEAAATATAGSAASAR